MFMPQPVLKIYYDALEQGKILGTKCDHCGTVEWPPLPTCNECGSFDMNWVEIEGTATIVDFYPTPKGGIYGAFKDYWPFYSCEGTLKEGTGFNGILLGLSQEDEENIKAKLPLQAKAKIIELEGFKTVVWELAE